METPPYEGFVDSVERTPHGILYFASIGGRPENNRLWSETSPGIEEARADITKLMGSLSDKHSVQFAISFPHITRIMAWQSPQLDCSESNLYEIGLYEDLRNYQEPSVDDQLFLGCPLELLLMAQETSLWMGASSVEEYLSAERTKLQTTLLEPNKIINSNEE